MPLRKSVVIVGYYGVILFTLFTAKSYYQSIIKKTVLDYLSNLDEIRVIVESILCEINSTKK